MPLFRKQPVVIEAHQVPPEGEECDAAMTIFLSGADPDSMESVGDGSIEIHTPEGSMVASPGDWIIKGVKGEYYPCKPDIFDQTYAPAEVVDGNVGALPTRDKPPIDEGMVETLKGLLARAERGEIESFVMAIKESDDRHAESRRRIAALEAELAAERERREAAEKDAARYQWLKINARRIDFAGLCVSDGAQLDARIDAARKERTT